MERTLP